MRVEMRRTDRQLTTSEAETILKENKYGILTTVCEDGYPYGVPMSYAYNNGKLYFHKSSEPGQLLDNISSALTKQDINCAKGGVKACFTVVGKTELLPEKFSTRYESAIVFGILKESKDKVKGLMELIKQLCPDNLEAGEKYANTADGRVMVYELEIEQITGKARKN